MGAFNTKTLLDAVTVTTTSDAFNVGGLSKIGLQFLSSAIATGNGVFTVEGTVDGGNWVALSMLVDNTTNTNVQGVTRVASKTLNSNTSIIIWLTDTALKAIRVVATVTTDGKYSAFVIGSE